MDVGDNDGSDDPHFVNKQGGDCKSIKRKGAEIMKLLEKDVEEGNRPSRVQQMKI